MFIRFLFIMLLFTPAVRAQVLEADIRYVDRDTRVGSDSVFYKNPLQWSLFKGAVPSNPGRVAAMTSSGFGLDAGMSYVSNKGRMIINVYCFFNQSKSWVKPDSRNDYTLNHEQRHFDISYIAALRFVQRLRLQRFTRNNYNDLIDKTYSESYAYLSTLQDAYDAETGNGTDKAKQAAWNAKIDSLVVAMRAAVQKKP